MGPTEMSVTVPLDITSKVWARSEGVVKNKRALPAPPEDVITLSHVELSESDDEDELAITPKSSAVKKHSRKVYKKNHVWQPMWAAKFPWAEPMNNADNKVTQVLWAEPVNNADNKATQVRCLVCTKASGKVRLVGEVGLEQDALWTHMGRQGKEGKYIEGLKACQLR
ncbi:unnamed protein product [Calypogeia fissa]